jgi:aspartyl/glutamyl-tRNA(Asn/Gln) amidotransferase C subunit
VDFSLKKNPPCTETGIGYKNCGTALYLSFKIETDMSEKVTFEDVQRVAELAHLELAPEETGPMVRDLNAILDYVAELNGLDTSNVVPLAQMSELSGDGRHAPGAGDRSSFFQGAQSHRTIEQYPVHRNEHRSEEGNPSCRRRP